MRTIEVPVGSWVSGTAPYPDGGVIVSGMFYGEALFEWGTPSQFGFEAGGGDAVFVARYGPDGTFLWATPFRGQVFGGALALTPEGNVIVAGTLRGGAVFGEGTSSQTQDTGGSSQGYIAWLARDTGALKEMGVLSGTGYTSMSGVKVLDDGSMAIVIGFTESFEWPVDPTHTLSFTSAGGSDIAIVRLLANGEGRGRRIGGPNDDWVDGFATTPGGDVVLTGPLPTSMTFDGSVADAASLSTTAPNAQFLCRYDAAGEVAWARVATESSDVLRNPGVAANADGTVVLATTYWWDTVVDPAGAAPARLPAPPDGDGLLECWDATGRLVSLGRLGGAGHQQPGAAAARADGSFVVLGVVTGSVTYDPSGPHPISGDGVGQDDFFVLDLEAPLP